MRFKRTLKQFQRRTSNFQTAQQLIRQDMNTILTRFSNMAGTLKTGDDWTAPTKDYRENFCKIKEIDADGKESYVIKESPELLKELEKTLLWI
jgi:hypothetical protein